jgi:ABC-type transport system involved in multi-copper enzyme maturation permease subunit
MTFDALREQAQHFRQAVRTIALWELRSFMRGWRAQLALFFCTAAVIGIGVFLLQTKFLSLRGHYHTAMELNEAMAGVGRHLFRWLTVLESGLILFLMPLLTAGAIGRERRQGTLESLLLTRFSALEIVTGKLAGTAGFFALVLLCALPVLAIGFLYGGVAPWELAGSQLLLLATAAAVGAAGIYCSARFRRPRTAVLLSYLGALLLFAVLCPALAAIPLGGRLLRSWKDAVGTGSRSCTTLILGLILFVLAGVCCPLSVLGFVTTPAIALVQMFSEDTQDFWWEMLVLPTAFLFLFVRLLLAGAAARIQRRDDEPVAR